LNVLKILSGMVLESSGGVGLHVRVCPAVADKVTDHRCGGRCKQNAIAIMTSRIMDAWNCAWSKNRESIRSCRAQARPRFKDWIISGVRRDLLRFCQQAAEAGRSIRQVEAGILIGSSNHEFSGRSRHKVRVAPADHVPEGPDRHSERKNLSFAGIDRNGRVQSL